MPQIGSPGAMAMEQSPYEPEGAEFMMSRQQLGSLGVNVEYFVSTVIGARLVVLFEVYHRDDCIGLHNIAEQTKQRWMDNISKEIGA